MKKLVCLLLTALMTVSLFSGCSGESPSGESTGDSQPISTETTSSPATEATSLPSTGFITLPDKIYTTCGNYNLTFYSWHAKKQSFSFYIMTEERLTPLAEITLPGITTPYSVNIGEPEFTLQQSLSQVLYAWWKSDYAFDIAEYSRLYVTVEEQRLLLSAGLLDDSLINPTTNLPYAIEQYVEIENRYILPYVDASNDYLDSVISGSYQPEWFWYEVEIRFEERIARTEETTEILLSAGDESYRIPIERLRLVSEGNPLPKQEIHGGCGFESALFPWSGGVTSNSVEPKRKASVPWGTGDLCYTDSIKALENIYLTDVYIYDNDHCTVTDVYICISGRQGIISVKWTPGEPFLIRKGEYAYIFAYYSDPHVSHGHYSGNPVRVMEFECENGTYCTYTAFLLNSDMRSNSSQHEIYLWQFKGLDLESYYLNYEERMREFLWNKYKNR